MAVRRVARTALALSCLLLASCGIDDPVLESGHGTGHVVVGSGNSVHSELIAQIYAGALARAGGDVGVEPKVGDRSEYLAALDEGRITLVPDTTGELLRHFDSAATQTEPDKVFEALNRSLPEGLSVSDYATAQDRDVVAVLDSTAKKYGSPGLDKLAPHCGELALGVTTDEAAAATTALTSVYGCTFGTVRTYAADELSSALLGGEVQAAVLPGVAPILTDQRVAVVPDDEYAFRAQNVVALFRKASLTDAQTLKLNVVAGELTTTDLADMIGKVRDGGQRPADVARTWLDLHVV